MSIGAAVTSSLSVRLTPAAQFAREKLRRLAGDTTFSTYDRFAQYTMVRRAQYLDNLRLALRARSSPGSFVECGVWRGGMIAGMAATVGNDRKYVLLDSFEGLPPADVQDGPAAAMWQADSSSPNFHDNCRAEEVEARRACALAGVSEPDIRPGWFADTVPALAREGAPIALLRLDGDWYESTMTCLEHLFPLVIDGGVIIIDDYGTWDGCNRAVHAYMTKHDRPEPICHTRSGVAYIVKRSE